MRRAKLMWAKNCGHISPGDPQCQEDLVDPVVQHHPRDKTGQNVNIKSQKDVDSLFSRNIK